ncbi:CIS tube protein [Chitinophagaceae bacterium MMS25-I14]
MLEKVMILPYNNPDYADMHLTGPPFIAMMNPESYSLEYKVEFTEGQGHGTSAAQQRFNVKRPDEMQFEFLFDATGIIDGLPRPTVFPEVELFKKMLLDYDSQSHEPKHFKLVWGLFIFKGRCNSLTINYKLFSPEGLPIRAVCKAGFKGSVEEILRVATENPQSPDLTHYRIVKQGDTLPLMCYQVYGDSKYYLQVARVNQLSNFRDIEPGTEIFFPPITKTKS